MRVIARWRTMFSICWKWMLDTSTNGTSRCDSWFRMLMQMLLDACACLQHGQHFYAPHPRRLAAYYPPRHLLRPRRLGHGGPCLSLSRAHPSVARPRARVHKHTNIRTHGLLIWSRALIESAARHAVSSFLLQLQNGPLTPISPARAPVGPTPAVKAVELEG